MKETYDKIIAWIKENKAISVGIAAAIILLFFPKLLKARRRRRVRRLYSPPRRVRTRRRGITLTKRGKPRKQYFKGGKAKKPWQIKGSLAAKRHMARIRRMR